MTAKRLLALYVCAALRWARACDIADLQSGLHAELTEAESDGQQLAPTLKSTQTVCPQYSPATQQRSNMGA